jgi:hypothetical protein
MANPRNVTSLEGIGIVIATFAIDNTTITYDKTAANGIGGQTANTGLAVSLSANGTVQLATTDDAIVGKLMSVEADNKAAVQVAGYTGFKGGSAATLTLGLPILGALGVSSARGCIKVVPTATTPTAAEVNAIAKGKGQLVDASDTTNVMVHIG